MLPGDSSKKQSSDDLAPEETTTARGSLVTHIANAKEISLRPSFTPGRSRFSPRLPPKSGPKEPNFSLNNLLHAYNTSSSASASASASTAAISIADNEDLLIQILLFLPPKSLLRFQSVSRQWLAIISSPIFCRLYSRRHPTTTKGLFLFRRRLINFITFSDNLVNSMGNFVSNLRNLFNNGEITSLHSCNGLLAVVFELDDYIGHKEFIVYNPTTRKHRIIPRLNSWERIHRYVALNIVFDPLKSDYYKLVYVWRESYANAEEYELTEERYGFSVYASEVGIWRDSMDTLEMDEDDPSMHIYFEKGVLWNGNLHWISDGKYNFWFDLDKECLNWTVPSLPFPLGRWDLRYFGRSGGCLFVIECKDLGGVVFDIFELSRDYSKWVLMYHVDLAPLRTLYPPMVDDDLEPCCGERCKVYIPCFLNDEKENKAKLVISVLRKIILYDTNDMTVKEIAEVDSGPGNAEADCWDVLYKWSDAHQHIETLAYV